MVDVGNNLGRRWRVGCVSYLNAKPLIHGVDPAAVDLQLEVPSKLIDRLSEGDTFGGVNSGDVDFGDVDFGGVDSGGVDLALCSIVDYLRDPERFELVPVGGIGCEGPTLTVRLFSRGPIERITAVHADADSHTSVMLLQVLLHDLYGLSPKMIHYDTRAPAPAPGSGGMVSSALSPFSRELPGEFPGELPGAMLLIGDKVVNGGPAAAVYPYQLDLGAAWRELTGRPFVFASWIKKAGTDLGGLPDVLAAQLEINLRRIDEIAERYAGEHGWPGDLAREYLGEILRYRVGPEELAAIEVFADRLRGLGLIESLNQVTRD